MKWTMRKYGAAGAFLVLVLVLAFRESILAAAGHLLVVANPVGSADVIVVTVDARKEGVLEAADLFHRGIAPQVAVFADPLDDVDREFIRRGVPYFDAAALSYKQLGALGVTNVIRIPLEIPGTKGEGQVLPGWVEQRRYHSVVVVTSSEHSRRVGRVLRRALQGHPVILIVQPSRYSKFDPDRWWQTRENLKKGIIEIQKLFVDVVLHPLS